MCPSPAGGVPAARSSVGSPGLAHRRSPPAPPRAARCPRPSQTCSCVAGGPRPRLPPPCGGSAASARPPARSRARASRVTEQSPGPRAGRQLSDKSSARLGSAWPAFPCGTLEPRHRPRSLRAARSPELPQSGRGRAGRAESSHSEVPSLVTERWEARRGYLPPPPLRGMADYQESSTVLAA